MTWQTGVPVVPGEDPSPFVSAASIADATSMVTNWGSHGVEHINADITLTLARLPVDREVGLAAVDRISAEGIAIGTATVFDRQGRPAPPPSPPSPTPSAASTSACFHPPARGLGVASRPGMQVFPG